MILVDVHAEATSEKVALAQWLDGRVTAVIGTHTHVQTADARVQPGGTAAITDVGMTGPARLGDRRQGRARDPPDAHGDAGALRGRRRAASGSRGCSSSATPRAAARRRSGRFEFPGPDRACRRARRGRRRRRRARGRAASTSHEAVGIELLHELPVVAREPDARERAGDDEQRDRGDAPRRPGRARRSRAARPGTAARRPCRTRRRPRPQRPRSGRSARRSRRRRGRSAPRRAASAATPAIVVTAEATVGDGPGQVLRARARRPAERHAERVVEREQHARAEALDLQRPPELAPDAPQRRPRARGSRTGGRRAATCRRVTASAGSAAAPALAPPRPRDEQRQEHGRVDLRRDRDPEQHRPERSLRR